MEAPQETKAVESKSEEESLGGHIHLREAVLACLGIGALTLAMYGDVLFRFSDEVISHPLGDTALYFAAIREFGFSEVANGNLPLWNPHVFSGSPFLGGFQSALLYPLNALYLVFPLALGLNIDICLHSFLLGVSMYVWVRRRGLHPASAFFAAGLMMFCGPYSLRVLAGQLTMLSTLAYVPLLFIAIDAIFDAAEKRQPLLGWILLGIFATSMQIFAGYPQAVFMTAVAAGAYCVLRILVTSGRIRAGAALLPVAVAPLLITMVQLWTGIEVGGESIRSGGGTYHFSSAFSFPFENLVTLFAPAFFGDRVHVEYWGRWNYWDVTAFMGVTGLLLAIYGSILGNRRARGFSGLLALLMLVIAFGRYTPVHKWFYDYVPAFDLFRSPSKFLFYAVFFAAMLAAVGIDDLIRRPRHGRGIAAVAFVLAIALSVGAGWVWLNNSAELDDDRWERFVRYEKDLEEGYIWLARLDEEYLAQSALLAMTGLSLAAATALAFGVLLWLAPRSRYILFAVLAIGLVEVFVFTRGTRSTFRVDADGRDEVAALYAKCTAGERVLDIARFDNTYRNYALRVRGRAIWGYDPVVLNRYGKFMAYAGGGMWHAEELDDHVFTWGSDPVGVALNLGFNHYTDKGMEKGRRFMSLLRTRFIIRTHVMPEYREFVTFLQRRAQPLSAKPIEPEEHDQEKTYFEIEGHFPEIFFVQDYRVMPADMNMLAEMMNFDIDLRETVFLEKEPDPLPGARLHSTSSLSGDRTTDGRTYQISLTDPAIMVITDSYSTGWRAVPLMVDAQRTYEVLPANYATMAIPLAAGEHLFRLEYAPAGYRYGRWISLVSVVAYLGVAAYWASSYRRRSGADSGE